MNNITIPNEYLSPSENVSILIASYNTIAIYISDCLNSIKNQNGNILKEIIWINDGSDEFHTKLLKGLLKKFELVAKHVKVRYFENDKNMGLGYSLNRGLELCSNEIVFRMDSDDIMMPNRIQNQLKYMKNNDIVICGGQIKMFRENINNVFSVTNHKEKITLEEFKKHPSHWFINHPSVCFRKSKVIEAGNYNKDIHSMMEDFELWLRILKKFKAIYNIQECVLYYRCHENQLTHNTSPEWVNKRNSLITDIINSS
jgi:cellulose synthase/poly-beta-1,6-N-acetylglucosamine synthase-like glycosyltransferase